MKPIPEIGLQSPKQLRICWYIPEAVWLNLLQTLERFCRQKWYLSLSHDHDHPDQKAKEIIEQKYLSFLDSQCQTLLEFRLLSQVSRYRDDEIRMTRSQSSLQNIRSNFTRKRINLFFFSSSSSYSLRFEIK